MEQQPADVQRFSPHLAKLLMNKSPYHAWCDAYKLGNRKRRPPSAAMIKGRLIDRLVFGVGDAVVVRQPRERVTEREGQIVVLQSEYDAAKECADSVLAFCEAEGIALPTSGAQPKWIWTNDLGVVCSGRPDHFTFGVARSRILDLKTSWEIHDRAVDNKWRDDWSYQAGAYLEAEQALNGTGADVVFIVAESSEPYDVRRVDLSPGQVDFAKKQWRRACLVWRQCLTTDQWPSMGNMTLSARGEGLGAFGDAVAFDSRNNNNEQGE